MSIEGSESIFSNNFYNPVFLQKDSIRQALKKVSMVAGAVLLASALAPCLLASVPLLAKITIMKSAGALGCFILAKFIPRGRDHMALSQWVQSQPEDAKAEAQQILDILKKIDLSRPFELDLRNRTKITSLPNILQNCTNFSCEGCTSLETLPKLPVCRTLNCIGCTSLQVLPPALPRCERLACRGCTSLRALPKLPVCERLECYNCTSLRELPPELPRCERLACRGCTSLRALPKLPVCERLECYDCTSLRELPPELPACTWLSCRDCTSLQVLPPALPVCEDFDCSNCTSLQALPELPVCIWLNCSACTSLQTLPPALPACTWLSCRNCTSLRELPPELPACTWLSCRNCTSLQTLPELPVCTTLSCSGCTSLQALPELPVCEDFDCSNCTSLQALSAELPVCSQISIRACPSLQNLPPLPSCMSLVLADCPQLRSIPDVPEGCTLLIANCPLLPPRPSRAPAQQVNLYQGRIDSAAQGTLQDALSFWSSLLPQGQEPLPAATTLLLSEVGQRLFQIFLNRLQETEDFRPANPQNRQNFALRVATIVRDMATSEEFREKAIMALGEANESCGDRVATGINNLELLSLMYGENKPKTDVDTACLAIRLARLDQVRKKAIKLNRGAEGLETVLFLELKLKDRLQLPLQTEGMLFGGIGHVAPETVDKTAQEILAATSTDKQLVDILVNSSVWTDFLQREYAFFYGDVLEGLGIIAENGKGTDYQSSLVELQQEPTDAWTQFLADVGPPNALPENREALQKEVLEVLRGSCPDLTGKDYNTAYNRLIQQLHQWKTIKWLIANGNALRARLKP